MNQGRAKKPHNFHAKHLLWTHLWRTNRLMYYRTTKATAVRAIQYFFLLLIHFNESHMPFFFGRNGYFTSHTKTTKCHTLMLIRYCFVRLFPFFRLLWLELDRTHAQRRPRHLFVNKLTFFARDLFFFYTFCCFFLSRSTVCLITININIIIVTRKAIKRFLLFLIDWQRRMWHLLATRTKRSWLCHNYMKLIFRRHFYCICVRFKSSSI